VRDTIDSVPEIVEILARRNLCTHTDGIVNDEYLTVCRKAHFPVDEGLHPGIELPLDLTYYRKAWRTLLLVGAEIGVSAWKQIIPAEAGTANEIVNIELLLNPLLQKQYALAALFGEFLLRTDPTNISDETSAFIRINTAQAYKWAGKQDKCVQVLSGFDWSQGGNMVPLGVNVLRDDYSTAAELMKSIGYSDDFGAPEYHNWPIFTNFRNSRPFLSSFQHIFGKSYPDFCADVDPVKPKEVSTLAARSEN